MLVSLVVATRGREGELTRLLESLEKQTIKPFEVVIVDQNSDDRLDSICSTFQSRLNLVRLRTPSIGASAARNLGFSRIQGDIAGFPDDDCWYPESVLEQVVGFFESHMEYKGLTGIALDEHGSANMGRWDGTPGDIDSRNEWTRSIEFGIFIRRSAMEELGGFDPLIGPGAGTPWGANEGDDLILRALEKGHRFFYDPCLGIFHPRPSATYDKAVLAKARAYGRGMGWVLRKHNFPVSFLTYWCLRSTGGMLQAALQGKWGRAMYYWETLLGRMEGWHGR